MVRADGLGRFPYRPIAAAAACTVALALPWGANAAGAELRRPTDMLEALWPAYPEWAAMLAEVLFGDPRDPDAGWFRKGVAQTRFDWNAVSARLDGDHDGRIVRREFPGSDAAFRRLDRDRDGALGPADLASSCGDPSRQRSAESISLEVFASGADRNGDGRLSREEYGALRLAGGSDPVHRAVLNAVHDELAARLAESEREGAGLLTLADFQEAFDLAACRGRLPNAVPRRAGAPLPARSAVLRAFLRGELGARGSGPRLNQPAPEFALPTDDGRTTTRLKDLVGPLPVVLIFGNVTCGAFRSHAGSLELLQRRYGDRVRFVVVYTREAHPADGWGLEDGLRAGVALPQPRDDRQRRLAARLCRQVLSPTIPILVDSTDDRVGQAYSAMPARLYIIDHHGKVAYKSGRGPYGFKPAELERSLILLLALEAG